MSTPTVGPLDGWTECDVPGCPSTSDADPEAVDAFDDSDGWAHGVQHHHLIDHYVVRLTNLEGSV